MCTHECQRGSRGEEDSKNDWARSGLPPQSAWLLAGSRCFTLGPVPDLKFHGKAFPWPKKFYSLSPLCFCSSKKSERGTCELFNLSSRHKQMRTNTFCLLIETTQQQCSHLRWSIDIFKLLSCWTWCQQVHYSHSIRAPAAVSETVVTLANSPVG